MQNDITKLIRLFSRILRMPIPAIMWIFFDNAKAKNHLVVTM